MSSQTPHTDPHQTESLGIEGQRLDMDALSDEEVAHLLFEDDVDQDEKGFLNLPTISGFALILVGAVYLFQEMGLWSGFDVSELVATLPLLAGIMIILLGLGVLSWRPRRRKKVKKGVDVSSGKKKVVIEEKSKDTSKRFRRSTKEKKIAGVCGGIAEYFNVDPTLVRIGFVAGLFFTDGMIILAYLLLAFALPKGDSSLTTEERIRIIRDS